MSTGGLELPKWSPCIMYLLFCSLLFLSLQSHFVWLSDCPFLCRCHPSDHPLAVPTSICPRWLLPFCRSDGTMMETWKELKHWLLGEKSHTFSIAYHDIVYSDTLLTVTLFIIPCCVTVTDSDSIYIPLWSKKEDLKSHLNKAKAS